MVGKISQQTIEALLARVDLVALLEPSVRLKKNGTNYTGLCPFHQEKTPSFSVNPNKQFFHCFGCGAHGDAIDFVARQQNLGFLEAVEWLAAQHGIPLETIQSNQENFNPLYQLLGAVAEYYQQQLRQDPQGQLARHYLEKRGLSPKTLVEFKIGFSSNQWDGVLRRFGGSAEKEALLLEAGLIVRKDNGQCYDRFRNRVIFPIFDQRNRILGFGGRVLDDSLPKYLNSPQTKLFHKSNALYGLIQAFGRHHKQRAILVVEGYLDVISLCQGGITNVVATMGTALTDQHLKQLFAWTDAVWLCFDGDKAGQQAAWKAFMQALPAIEDGQSLRFILLPQGQDPDSIMRERGTEQFKEYCKASLSFEEFFFQHMSAQVAIDTLEGKARLFHLAKPLIQTMKPGVLQTLMLQKLQNMVYQSTQKPYVNYKKKEIKPEKPIKPLSVVQKIRDILSQYPGFHTLIDSGWEALAQSPVMENKKLYEQIRVLKNLPPNVGAEPAAEGVPAPVWLQTISEDALQRELQALIQQVLRQPEKLALKQLIALAKTRSLSTEEKAQLSYYLKKQDRAGEKSE
jgi:DNA primase